MIAQEAAQGAALAALEIVADREMRRDLNAKDLANGRTKTRD